MVTKEENEMVWETKKYFLILKYKSIQHVRVPVFYGHSEAVHIENKTKISCSEARKILSTSPGVKVIDERVDGGYPTAVTEASGEDATFVGRIREDISHSQGLNLWIVSDNVRKGAAT